MLPDPCRGYAPSSRAPNGPAQGGSADVRHHHELKRALLDPAEPLVVLRSPGKLIRDVGDGRAHADRSVTHVEAVPQPEIERRPGFRFDAVVGLGLGCTVARDRDAEPESPPALGLVVDFDDTGVFSDRDREGSDALWSVDHPGTLRPQHPPPP